MKKVILSVLILLMVCAETLSQNVGIGSNSPVAKLEVKGDGTTSLNNNLILKNSAGDTLLRVRNDGRVGLGFNGSSYGRTMNLGGNGLNFYRTDEVFGGAIFPTDTSIVMWSQINDNNYVILQPSWGKVGIGTFSPDAMLHVNGSVILGNGGTVITKVIKTTVTKNLASIPAGGASIETFTVTGAQIGSSVSISPGLELIDGIVIAYARVVTANTVEVKFMNVSAVAINHGLTAFFITVIE